MLNEAMTIAGQVGIIAALGLLGAAFQKKSFNPAWFAVALLLYVAYDVLLTRGLFLLPNLPAGSHWNWLGKFLALSGTLALAALPVFGFARAGITLQQRKGMKTALIVVAVTTILYLYLAVSDGESASDLETIAFQWTMPGLDEEIFYRGLLLLAMNEAFRARIPVAGAAIGYGGLLTSVLFGLAHALSFEQAAFSFDLMAFAITGVPSLLLLWLRERTGSVVLPIIAHNLANGIPALI